ncbi:MAG: cellulose synthase catalytic subunit (UDP-forming) [Croceicoccus sp.]|nr:cellulose synthase catalytic subunit (UDP-forming) [Croceicoccus sp.]MAL26641.1 cellulose synthase catalytic subunit (UDP-forming) [Croceicoccus sp.]|tara:strand:- start:5381 stop:9736 length:4356 start_codon:yes stop_codon:yes gene_type:complete
MPKNLLLRLPLWLAAFACMALIITIPLDEAQQWIFAIGMIGVAAIVHRNAGRRATLIIGVLALLASTRYMIWRTMQTLSFETPLEYCLGMGLYLAEAYAWLILVLGLIQTSWPLHRPIVEIEGEPETWPTIDVYIPTYNESLEIVRNTVFAAMDMDYPRDRFNVYILDDGKREEFREFARQAKCGYLTRGDNLHAKAGNLNAAMKKTHGELVAIFDCDHVPTRAFLQMTVGWFQKDPKLALMQTPHHFYSPDPVQRNLRTVKDLPGEGDLFYGAVQSGNDLWNATFFCGSCAIIRRTALMQTNGFAGETVTEDAHTALKLQRMGWNTAYIGARLSAGLATERLVLHIGQRIRWARGMTQIFRIDNPLMGRGLSWQQRLCYLNAMMHFQFPLPRIVFLTAPLAFLIAGQNIIFASASLIFANALPHLFISTLSSERTQGGDRRPFWGEIYETLLAFHLARPTIMTLFQPRKGKFNVTDKGSVLDRTHFDLKTVQPHLFTIGLLIFGVVLGIAKYMLWKDFFDMQLGTLLLNLGWALFSMLILLAAVSVARETRQIRGQIRIDTKLPVTVYFEDGVVVDCITSDFSMGGLAAQLPKGFEINNRDVTHVSMPMGDDMLTLPVDTVRTDAGTVRLRFEKLSMFQSRQLVRAVMGRADAWQQAEGHAPVSGLRSLRDITVVALTTLRRIVRPSLRKVPANVPAPATSALLVVLLATCIALAGFGTGTAMAQTSAQALMTEKTVPVVTGDGVRKHRITLKDLTIGSPIRLKGTRGEIGIPFGLRSDEVVTDASVTLDLAYSPDLLDDISQLVVLLNGEVLRTVALTADTSDRLRLTLDVEPALFLPGDNQLNIRFLGHYARDCEDPFHSSLWLNLSNRRSFIDLTTQRLALPADLADLPAPFFDSRDPLPLRLPFIFTDQPGNSELEAAGVIASWMGSKASYRGFAFPPSIGTLPKGNAIVFLSGNRRIAGIERRPNGPSVAVIRNPADRFGKLLLVMGRTGAELKLAANGLAFTRGLAGGATASMSSVRVPVFKPYAAPRWLRNDRPVELSEFTEPFALEGRGLPPGPLTAQFRVAPDLFFWPRSGARLDMAYRYPAASWLDLRASRLDVSMNAQYLRTLGMGSGNWWSKWISDGPDASSREREAHVILPAYILFGQNELVFDYSLILADKRKCEGTLPDNVRVNIMPRSTIDLTGTYHSAQLPNLSMFASAGYPFTVRPDLAATAVLLPANADISTIETFLMIMGRMGDATGIATARVAVTNMLNSELLGDKDILVIGPDSMAAEGGLFDNAPIRFESDRLRVAERSFIQKSMNLTGIKDQSVEANEALYASDSFAGIASFQSPFNSDRTVVAVLASDTAALPRMMHDLDDAELNAQVQGGLSIVSGDGMSSYHIGKTYTVSDLPWWLALAHWLSRYPLLMALGALLSALFIAGVAYRTLQAQQARRLKALDDGK